MLKTDSVIIEVYVARQIFKETTYPLFLSLAAIVFVADGIVSVSVNLPHFGLAPEVATVAGREGQYY